VFIDTRQNECPNDKMLMALSIFKKNKDGMKVFLLV
jgi:hypothetical protein